MQIYKTKIIHRSKNMYIGCAIDIDGQVAKARQ